MADGWVKLYRKAADHPLFKGDSKRLGAWCWLLMNAAWKDTRQNVAGKVVTVERGKISTSYRILAAEWGWSKSAVERFITRLKTETVIEVASGTGRILITIRNYDNYQGDDAQAGTPRETPTGTAAGQQRDTKEEGKKERREEDAREARSILSEVVGDDLASEFARYRMRMRKPLSPTAAKLLTSKLGKIKQAHGMAPADAVGLIMEKGWQSIEVDWVKPTAQQQAADYTKGLSPEDLAELERRQRARAQG